MTAANSPSTSMLPDSDVFYEVIDGQVVELPPMGAHQIGIANDLLVFLAFYLVNHPLGQAFVEMLFRLRNEPRLERKPDVAFVPYERWPARIIPDTEAWEVIPALAAEVISKTNTAEAVEAKIEDYFKHGVSVVWVIYPRQRRIYVYEGPKTVRILDVNDTLDGSTILPEFQLPVVQLFEGTPRPEAR